jgi:hypothetical protein
MALLLFCLLALCCNSTPKRKLAFASDVAQNAPGVRYNAAPSVAGIRAGALSQCHIDF